MYQEHSPMFCSVNKKCWRDFWEQDGSLGLISQMIWAADLGKYHVQSPVDAEPKESGWVTHFTRAQQYVCEVDWEDSDWTLIKRNFSQLCAYCNKAKPLTRDHYIPMSSGGAHAPWNVVPACKSCNSSKHSKHGPTWIWEKWPDQFDDIMARIRAGIAKSRKKAVGS